VRKHASSRDRLGRFRAASVEFQKLGTNSVVRPQTNGDIDNCWAGCAAALDWSGCGGRSPARSAVVRWHAAAPLHGGGTSVQVSEFERSAPVVVVGGDAERRRGGARSLGRDTVTRPAREQRHARALRRDAFTPHHTIRYDARCHFENLYFTRMNISGCKTNGK